MADVTVAKASSFEDPGRKVFDINGTEVGIFKLGGQFYAWENRCPHLDGPAVQGRLGPDEYRLPLARLGIRLEDGRLHRRKATQTEEV